jgi:hypothetical protein
LLNASRRKAHLKLHRVKEPEGRSAPKEKVGVRVKSDMDSMEPCGGGETLSRREDALMTAVKAVEDADGQYRSVFSRATKLFALQRRPAEKVRLAGGSVGSQLASTGCRRCGGAAFGVMKTRSGCTPTSVRRARAAS